MNRAISSPAFRGSTLLSTGISFFVRFSYPIPSGWNSFAVRNVSPSPLPSQTSTVSFPWAIPPPILNFPPQRETPPSVFPTFGNESRSCSSSAPIPEVPSGGSRELSRPFTRNTGTGSNFSSSTYGRPTRPIPIGRTNPSSLTIPGPSRNGGRPQAPVRSASNSPSRRWSTTLTTRSTNRGPHGRNESIFSTGGE